MTIIPVVHLYQIAKKPKKLPSNYAIYLPTIQKTKRRALFPLVFVSIKYVMLALLSRRLALSVFVNGCNRRLVRQWNIKRTFTPILPYSLFLFFPFIMLCPQLLYLQHWKLHITPADAETIQFLPVINHPLSPCFDIWKMRSFPRQVYSWRCHRSDPLIGWHFNMELPSQKLSL